MEGLSSFNFEVCSAFQDFSIVEYFSSREGYSCGYCNGRDTNYSYGMQAYDMTVDVYQNLIDRGWRRSGKFCYKPINNVTCCPMYTIKCEATDFHITKSQKKILKKMAKFLRNELSKDETMDVNNDDRNTLDINVDNAHRENAGSASCKLKMPSMHKNVNKLLTKAKESCCPKKPEKSQSIASKSDFSGSLDARVPTVNVAETPPAKGPCRKAKLIRIERKKNKLLAQGRTLEEIEKMFRERKLRNRPKSFDELFEESMKGTRKLEMRLVSVKSHEFKSTLGTSAALYKKYQMAIHRDPPEKCNEKTFVNFLVSSPLNANNWKTADRPAGYGSFHEQYWLDGQLIAIAVIDILPYCVSSVYFIYDPDYSYLSLGTFSALREVYLTRQLSRIVPELKYYYMGFYIHTSHKTRYKARLRPSKLLCTETNTWHEIGPCIKMLERQKYCRFNTDMDATDVDGVVDIRNVLIPYKSKLLTYPDYRSRVSDDYLWEDDQDEVKEYAKLVGKKCVSDMLLLRSIP